MRQIGEEAAQQSLLAFLAMIAILLREPPLLARYGLLYQSLEKAVADPG